MPRKKKQDMHNIKISDFFTAMAMTGLIIRGETNPEEIKIKANNIAYWMLKNKPPDMPESL